MINDKRRVKELQIINAAEKVFFAQGYSKTKMEDIANELDISKGSIYFYFSSKENLYLAVTHRGLEVLLDQFYRVKMEGKKLSGLESTVNLFSSFIHFMETNPFYADCLIRYYSQVANKHSNQDYLDGVYNEKIKTLHRMPSLIIIAEIQRGIEDGSIKKGSQPELLFLSAWAFVVGYVDLTQTYIKDEKQVLGSNLKDLKDYIVSIARTVLKNGIIDNA